MNSINFSGLKINDLYTRRVLENQMNQSIEKRDFFAKHLESLDRISGKDTVILSAKHYTTESNEEFIGCEQSGNGLSVANDKGEELGQIKMPDNILPFTLNRKLSVLTEQVSKSLNTADNETSTVLDRYM